MERLTFDGNFCDIAQCKELPCPHDNNCTQKQVWDRLKSYEDTGLEPEAVETVKLALCAKHMVDLETLNNTPISRLVELAAADLIERLEKEKAALISTISGFCQWCKNLDADENSCRVWVGCSICDRKCPCAGCRDGSKWEWRGLAEAPEEGEKA